MSYENKDWTEHTSFHYGVFIEGCSHCENAKTFGIWSNGEFITFAEMENWERTDDGTGDYASQPLRYS
jgi:hypothetical protein